MRITFHTIIMVFILCFSLVGQAFAYEPVPCDMDHNTMSSMMSSDMSASSDNCCDSECSCPVNACNSSSWIFSDYLTPKTHALIAKISFQEITITLSQYNVLYRPPIFA